MTCLSLLSKQVPNSARWIAAVALLVLAGCGQGEKRASTGRPVRAVSVEATKFADNIQLSGEIQAEKSVSLAFRIAGRVVDRFVNVGERVQPGQVVARLDPATERNALSAAKAALVAARGEVSTARTAFERQDRLLAQGFTTRPRFDQTRQAFEAAQAQLEAAEAQVELARDRLSFTELQANVAGVVTARSIEPGEFVQAGQAVLQIARDDGRDAVFNVPARLLETHADEPTIRVTLADAPSVVAFGRVREVSPQADPVTRTFQMRVGLENPPETMRLGSTVNGTMELTSAAIVAIPAGALTMSGLSPAVWVIDPNTSTVSLRNIDVLRFDASRIIVSEGLEPGEIIVSGGIHALHPGQRVQQL